MSDQRMLDRFVRLCETPSPTGAERAVADDVLGELRELGVEVREDDAAEPARAGAGNLIATRPGARDGWVSFFAHLDTVPEPGRDRGRARRRGVSQPRARRSSGADNKAAVTVLVELAARHAAAAGRGRARARVHRRRGGRPARREGARPRRAALAVRLRARPREPDRRGDHGGADLPAARGRVRGTRGPRRNPARGRPLGDRGGGGRDRRDEARPARPGDDRERRRDRGGVASNVVAGHCRIDGEARSLDERSGRARRSAAMVDACTWAASRARVRRRRRRHRDVPRLPASHRAHPPSRSRARRSSAAASSRARSRPAAAATRTRSSRRGFDCVLLANGTEANHTPSESVARGANRPRCSRSARRSPSSPARRASEAGC